MYDAENISNQFRNFYITSISVISIVGRTNFWTSHLSAVLGMGTVFHFFVVVGLLCDVCELVFN